MSISASINWVIHKDQISWVEIIQMLLANGWSLNDNGKMTYLALHDNGLFNWLSDEINEEYLIKVLKEKERIKESLGVCITWEESNIGGTLLTLNENEILFSLDINRKTIQLGEREIITNVNWYLLKFNPILYLNKKIIITSTNFFECL